tara:strand:+ start:833 stop:1177 length:345 start_codon:yes stop_codon:yes gene_type:complete
MNCNCDCHKKKNESDLKSCKERNKVKDREIARLNKKVLTLTIAIAVVGTFVGQKTIEQIAIYFETIDKVKQSIDKVTSADLKLIEAPFQYGIAPSPSAIAVFGLPLLMPCKRRR